MLLTIAFVLSMAQGDTIAAPTGAFADGYQMVVAQRYQCWVQIGSESRPCTPQELRRAIRRERRTRLVEAARRRPNSEFRRDMREMELDLEEGEREARADQRQADREFRRDMRHMERDMQDMDRDLDGMDDPPPHHRRRHR